MGNSPRLAETGGSLYALKLQSIRELARPKAALLYDLVAVYGIHFANQALPLITIPYLSRTLGPAGWGLVAMAQSFGGYGNLIVDYGFIYSATRRIATESEADQIEKTIAGGVGRETRAQRRGSMCGFCSLSLRPSIS